MVKLTTEAALPMNQSHDSLRGHLRKALQTAHNVPDGSYYSDGPYIMDVFPSHVVYQHKGQSYKRKYTLEQGAAGTDPKVTLGDAKGVHVAYMDSKEAVTESKLDFKEAESVTVTLFDDELTSVLESGDSVMCFTVEQFESIKESKGSTKVPIKIMKSGWGSRAFYSKEVLQRDGPTVFKKGTHMYWNHATESQEAERPEGDLNDLAAVMTQDAVWKENGPKGPGLYTEAKVFSDYSTQVSEKGPYIGVSINAAIKCHEGEIEGRSGNIADKLVRAFSTDFVTKPGAGGAPIVPVQESERPTNKEKGTMTDVELKALNDRLTALESDKKRLEEENAKYKAQDNVTAAIEAVTKVLTEAEVDFNPKLVKRACAVPVMKEGKVDPEWVKSVAEDFAVSESAGVRGLGPVKESSKVKPEDVDKALESALGDLGVGKSGMDAAMGRN